MKYAVQLKGLSEPVFEQVSGCYQGDFVKISKIGEYWFLQSPAFDGCAKGTDVIPIAAGILQLIHHVTAIYAGLFAPIETGFVECFSNTGVFIDRTVHATHRVQIYSGEGISWLHCSAPME
jgi:hypothetical protein